MLPIRTSLLKQKKKNSSSTLVLTSSPYKDTLSSSVLPISTKKIEQGRNGVKRFKHANTSLHSGSWFCYLCEENIEKNMIKCIACQGWCHVDCAGVNQKQKQYICNFCQK